MAINDNFLRDLQERTDIEQLVGSYLDLKRRGKTLVGLCPFHNEKTPSFTVYPESNSFYCFGCGAGGDAITFIRRIENLDYIEAVKFVAQAAGMKMPEDGFDDTLSKKRGRILSANREAARFFHKTLYSEAGKDGLSYFAKRMLSKETITHFGLGFAPDSWDSLRNHLKSLGFSDMELYEANLIKRSEKNGAVHWYDNFRKRVMFPIIDLRGNVVGFSGRVLDDSKPKYVNTADTLVYKKGNGIFAMNFAKNANDGKFILVEGQMDVITLHQAGFTNAIACLGTAFTQEQANLISRYADEVYICYDSDGAGQSATKKALAVLGSTGLRVRIVRLEGGKDADEIIKLYGKERFRALLEGAANKIEYDIIRERAKYNLSTDDGMMNFLNAAADILAAVGNIERDIYAARLANETGVSKEAILAKAVQRSAAVRKKAVERKRAQETRMLTDIKDKNNPEKEKNLRAARAEEIIIASLARNPDFYKKFKSDLKPDLFITAFNKRILTVLLQKLESENGVELSFFAAYFNPEEMDSITRIFRLGEEISNTPEEIGDCIETLKKEKSTVGIKASELSDEEFAKLFRKNKNTGW